MWYLYCGLLDCYHSMVQRFASAFVGSALFICAMSWIQTILSKFNHLQCTFAMPLPWNTHAAWFRKAHNTGVLIMNFQAYNLHAASEAEIQCLSKNSLNLITVIHHHHHNSSSRPACCGTAATEHAEQVDYVLEHLCKRTYGKILNCSNRRAHVHTDSVRGWFHVACGNNDTSGRAFCHQSLNEWVRL